MVSFYSCPTQIISIHRRSFSSIVILLHLICCLSGASIVYCVTLIRDLLSSLDIKVYGNSFVIFAMFAGVAIIIVHAAAIQVNYA